MAKKECFYNVKEIKSCEPFHTAHPFAAGSPSIPTHHLVAAIAVKPAAASHLAIFLSFQPDRGQLTSCFLTSGAICDADLGY